MTALRRAIAAGYKNLPDTIRDPELARSGRDPISSSTMTYVRCPGCDTIHESTRPVCPGCGRCPACGERRATRKYLAEHVACPACGLPYSDRCWRCHGCGKPRYIDAGTCTCGFLDDPAKLARMGEVFSLSAKLRGCLSLIAELARTVIPRRVK